LIVPTYEIDSQHSRVVVRSTSPIHDTTTTWSAVRGTIDANPADLATGTTAQILVDMTRFDAGDFLRNRALRKIIAEGGYRDATFELAELHNLVDMGNQQFSADALGELRWRGKAVPIQASGTGTFTAQSLQATATFALDVTRLGVEPPRFLLLKVDDTVSVTVTITAHVRR
jgi:hypothetical protein